MPFLAPFAVPLITAAGSAIAGGLANRKKTNTSSSTTTPTLTPEMQPLQTDLMARITAMMDNPSASLEPMRVTGRSQINSLYADAPDTISRQMSQRGFGGSGKQGKALIKTDLARRGQMAGFEGNLANAAISRQTQAMDLANRMLAMGRGTSSTGTSTDPGNVLGGAVGAGSETLTTMLLLDKILKGSGGETGGFDNFQWTGN